jgi:hypothetical protein
VKAGGINPFSLKGEITNPLARMLPLYDYQRQVYRMGEAHPPTERMQEYAPHWVVFDMVLGPLSTLQIRKTLHRGFTLLALTCSTTSNVSGGFRAQIYDLPRKRRLADRGVNQALIGGLDESCFLREPYPLDLPNHQILIIAQNLEAVQNAVQLVLYGPAKGIDQK